MDEHDSIGEVARKVNLIQVDSVPVSAHEVAAYSHRDLVIGTVVRYVRTGWSTDLPEELKSFYRRREELSVEADCLTWGLCVVIPEKLRDKVKKGFPGIVKMKHFICHYVWRPELTTN